MPIEKYNPNKSYIRCEKIQKIGNRGIIHNLLRRHIYFKNIPEELEI